VGIVSSAAALLAIPAHSLLAARKRTLIRGADQRPQDAAAPCEPISTRDVKNAGARSECSHPSPSGSERSRRTRSNRAWLTRLCRAPDASPLSRRSADQHAVADARVARPGLSFRLQGCWLAALSSIGRLTARFHYFDLFCNWLGDGASERVNQRKFHQ